MMQRSLRRSSRTMQVHYRKGLVCMKLRQYGGAATSFEQAKQIKPSVLQLQAAFDNARKKKQQVSKAAAKPASGAKRCHCGGPVHALVAYKGDPADVGRVFARCQRGKNVLGCSFFEWADHTNANACLNHMGVCGHATNVSFGRAKSRAKSAWQCMVRTLAQQHMQ